MANTIAYSFVILFVNHCLSLYLLLIQNDVFEHLFKSMLVTLKSNFYGTIQSKQTIFGVKCVVIHMF